MIITTTLHESGAAAVITVTPSGTVNSLTRADRNGNADVRVPPGTFPTTAPFTITDWEAALGTSVNYTVHGYSSALTLPSRSPWLVTPLRPAYSMELEQVSDLSVSRSTLATIHQVVDRPDPLVSLGRLGTRTGNLDIYCEDLASATSRANILDLAGLLQLKTPELGLDMYFIPLGASTRQVDGATMLSVNYQETIRPTSPITAGSWTFSSVSTAYPSFNTITSAYQDFEGLSLNDRDDVVNL